MVSVNFGSGQFSHSEIGFPKGNSPEEFLQNMHAFIEEAAAKIANPAPWPAFSPADLRELAAFQEAVLIEQRVRQGDRTISALADTLRRDIWDRLRAGQGLAAIGDISIASMSARALPKVAEAFCSSQKAASASPTVSEIEIRICEETPGYEAAAAFLSILAYPEDLEARKRFRDAYCQHAIRGLARDPAWANSRQSLRPQCLLEAEDRARTAYKRGMKLINSERLVAARMLAPKLRLVADIAASKPLGHYPARTNRKFLCEVAAELKTHTGDNTKLNEYNFIHRKWSSSRSVLHLAIAIAGDSTQYRPIDDADPHSIYDERDAIVALAERSEKTRRIIAGAAGLDPDSLIRVRVKRY